MVRKKIMPEMVLAVDERHRLANVFILLITIDRRLSKERP